MSLEFGHFRIKRRRSHVTCLCLQGADIASAAQPQRALEPRLLTETHYFAFPQGSTPLTQALWANTGPKTHLRYALVVIDSPTTCPPTSTEEICESILEMILLLPTLTFFRKSGVEVLNLSEKARLKGSHFESNVFRDNFYSSMKLSGHVNRGRPSVST